MKGYLMGLNTSGVIKGKVRHIPALDTSLRKAGYAADAKAVGNALDGRVKTADIIDNLNSNDAEKPLSARQGAVLKQQLDALSLLVDGGGNA